MPRSVPVLTLVTYRPKKGKEAELLALVQKHWPALQKAGLVTPEPAKVWKATDKRKGTVAFVELFSWRDDEASGIAHQTPEVMAVWEPMGAAMENMTIEQLEAV
jgi:quinol monooxygenase YgiN